MIFGAPAQNRTVFSFLPRMCNDHYTTGANKDGSLACFLFANLPYVLLLTCGWYRELGIHDRNRTCIL